MSGQNQLTDALRLGSGMIERQLDCAFSELDAATHSVEVRKLLHAIFVQRAFELAGARFPRSHALKHALEQMQAAGLDIALVGTG